MIDEKGLIEFIKENVTINSSLERNGGFCSPSLKISLELFDEEFTSTLVDSYELEDVLGEHN